MFKDFSQYNKTGEYSFPVGFLYEYYQSVSFDMHDEDTVFQFGKQDMPQDISVAYLSGTQNLQWMKLSLTIVSLSTPDSKNVSLKFAHSGAASWADDRTPGTTTPNMLKLQFRLPEYFQVKDETVTEKVLFWDTSADRPEHYGVISVPLPSLDMSLPGLDYFLTTNLILPGAHLFIADPVDDQTNGLFVPRDVLLTGQVAQDVKAPQ